MVSPIYELTSHRTDDGSMWRKFFGDNKVGLFWGQPIYKLSQPYTFSMSGFSQTIPKGFETDLGTVPGIFGVIVNILEVLGLVKTNLDSTAILHDYLWMKADGVPLEYQPLAYHLADVHFYYAMLSRGQTKWFAKLVYHIVRTVAKIKILGRSRWK